MPLDGIKICIVEEGNVRKLLATPFLVVLLVVAGCGGGSESAGPTEEEGATLTAGGDTETSGGGDTEIAGDDRCLPVPKALTDALEDGLRKKGKDTGIEPTGIGKGAAVKSDDFEKVFYVSAPIEGPDQVGTWATNSLKVGEGLIIAADSVAMEFTDWGAAAQPGSPAAEVQGLENDGAQESRDCIAGA